MTDNKEKNPFPWPRFEHAKKLLENQKIQAHQRRKPMSDDSIHAELREWVEWSREHYDDPEDARTALIEYVDWAFQRVAVEEEESKRGNSLHAGRAGHV